MTNFEGFQKMVKAMNESIQLSSNKDAINCVYLGLITGYLAQISDALNKMAGIEIKETEDGNDD